MNNSRFKFRVWDIERKVMLYDVENDDFHEAIHSPNPLMQCAGLKDKNGTLIYEGDIVEIGDDKATITRVCEWDDSHAGFVFTLPSREWNFLPQRVKDERLKIEILGNIYEHKDLVPKR